MTVDASFLDAVHETAAQDYNDLLRDMVGRTIHLDNMNCVNIESIADAKNHLAYFIGRKGVAPCDEAIGSTLSEIRGELGL